MKAVKILARQKRHRRLRKRIRGTEERPRLCVYRSNKHIYAQIIFDEKNHTLVSASDLELSANRKAKSKEKKEGNKELKGKTAVAWYVGELLAKKALKKKITRVCFDKGGFKYHGRVRALAEGARKGGLKF